MSRPRVIAAVVVTIVCSTVVGACVGIPAAVASMGVLLGCAAIVALLSPMFAPKPASPLPRPTDEPTIDDPAPPAETTPKPEDVGTETQVPPKSKQEDLEHISHTTPETEQQTGPKAPSFLFGEFTAELLASPDPMAFLVDFANRTSKSKGATPFERHLAERLKEAHVGTWKGEGDAPRVDVVIPRHSGAFYLRESAHMQRGHHVQVLRIEAALNAARYADDYFDDPCAASEEDLVRLEQRVANSICAQASNITASDWSYLAMPWQTGYGPSERGEWAVRSSLSESIETLSVPYRLEANFRSNVAGGDVAIEVAITPACAFPRTALADGLGIVPTTPHMRGRMASRYAAHMAILLANCAFRASERIRRVWIAGIKSTPTRRCCLYWGRIDRRAFMHVRMDAVRDPLRLLRELGATLNLEGDVLRPVHQGFYLEDERFCPPQRHDLWRLSERSLPPSAAMSLGTQRVSGLVIHEELMRMLVAEDAIRGLARTSDEEDSTQVSVRSVLDAAGKTSDVDVWCAAERVATMLVEGKLASDDPSAVEDELVSGDPLTRAVERAQAALQRQRPDEAFEELEAALRKADKNGAYDDTPSVAYRSFDSFAQRVLYNRLNSRDTRCVVLVPDAYVVGHLLFSAMLLTRSQAQGMAQPDDARRALQHAQRAHHVAPLSVPAVLSIVACHDVAGNHEAAAKALAEMLELAHDPQGIALAYYRMAAMQWHLGHREACMACYQLAAGISPALLPVILAEWQAIAGNDPSLSGPLEATELETALRENDIPLAPTPRISFLLFDCAAASVDAEVFPVAHDLMRILESFTGDDVIHGIRNSLEREPDA